METLQKHLTALEPRYPNIVSQLLSLPDKDSAPGEVRLELLDTPVGCPTLVAESPDKQSILLHSARDPRRDAARMVSGFGAKKGDQIVVLGVGLGYHLAELLNAMQGVVGSEDQLMQIQSLANSIVALDFIYFSGAHMMSFTTVNMQHFSISNVLKILRRELLSKQNARSNNYNSLGSISGKLTHSIHDAHQCFTSTCGKDTLPNRMFSKCIQCSLLVRTKSRHQCMSYVIGTVWRLLTLIGSQFEWDELSTLHIFSVMILC